MADPGLKLARWRRRLRGGAVMVTSDGELESKAGNGALANGYGAPIALPSH